MQQLSLRVFAEASRCRCAAICIHEEDASIAWRHHDGRGGGNYVRRNRRLVVSSWFTVGNYDCETHHSSSFPSLSQLTTLSFAPDGVRYMMYPDGNLEVDISLSGIVRARLLLASGLHSSKSASNDRADRSA